MSALVYLNGEVTAPEDAKVSVFDRGFLFGDGVYETGKSSERCFLFLDEHWARLRRSAGKLLISIPWSDEELKSGLYQVARAFGKDDAYFRTVISRGVVDRVGLDSGSRSLPTLVHIIQDLEANPVGAQSGVSLLTSRVVRNAAQAQDPDIKSSNYLNSLLALQDVKGRGGEDAILCDAQGRVTEGTTFSVFAVTAEGKLITPALEVGILDSITRRHVLKVARERMPVEEGIYSREAFFACPELFIASSVRGIFPVREWDGKKYRVPGPVTRRLRDWYAEDTREYVRTHEKF